MVSPDAGAAPWKRDALLRRGVRLEYATLAWNVVGCVVLLVAALDAGSIALAGFGVDSVIEIVASAVVLWQLKGVADDGRERVALCVIAAAFALLALYITTQSVVILASNSRPGSSDAGIVWLAATVLVMLMLAAGKRRTGAALGNALLSAESRVTVVDALLAGAVLLGVVLNAAAGWWWADPVSALVIVPYGLRETRHSWRQAQCAAVAPAC